MYRTAQRIRIRGTRVAIVNSFEIAGKTTSHLHIYSAIELPYNSRKVLSNMRMESFILID